MICESDTAKKVDLAGMPNCITSNDIWLEGTKA